MWYFDVESIVFIVVLGLFMSYIYVAAKNSLFLE